MPRTKIIELTKSYDKPNSTLEYPVIIDWYPIALIVDDTIEKRIVQYLKETVYVKQPTKNVGDEFLKSQRAPYDWAHITLNFYSHKIICVSEKVWADKDFRLVIMEYLI